MSPVLILAMFLPLQNQPLVKCSLSGTVVNSVTGEPLNKVDLRLEPLNRQATHVAVTKSDGEGRFALVDLDPGSYRLIGSRSGYFEMSYGARRPDSDGSVVRLESGQFLIGLNFKLTPSAVISGTVRDSDGEPLEGAHVILANLTHRYGRPQVEGCDSTDTDDRGEYRFRGLAAGKYYIGVEPKSHGWDRVDHSVSAGPLETSVPTVYPGVSDIGTATPIEVSAGSRVTGIDVTLLRSRVFRVSGRVVNAPTAGRLTIQLLDAINSGMRDYTLRTSTKDAAGDFEFRGVPPGSYELTVDDQSLRGRTSIVVSASDLEDIRVPLSPGAQIKFRIITEGADKPNVPGLDFFLTANGRTGFGPLPRETDRLTVRNVPPGHYDLKLTGLPRGAYVKNARAGETDVLADGLTVTGAGTIDIAITVAFDGGAVQGVVLDKNQQPVSGATILLAPDRRSRADLFDSTTSDQNGHYEFTAIAPGNYKLFAWEDVEPKAWEDTDFLKDYEKLGEKTALEPSARASVDLRIAIRPDPQ
jgi:protocatechuate 3,4-dioxygenase beta subunit/5-hydroxyisourate hydrolase-like protein (transthyretin family)